MSSTPCVNAILVGDFHIGDQTGLINPALTGAFDFGGDYIPSRNQVQVWEMWEYFWDQWVPVVTRHQDYCVILMGDTVDGLHHNSNTMITANRSDQRRLAREILAPIIDKAKGGTYTIRGTEAHVGQAGEDEETLYEQLGTVPDERGRFSRFELWLQIGNALIHAMHHIGTTGSLAYETTALMKEYSEAMAEAARWGNPPPDFVVRAHRHRHAEIKVPSSAGYGYCFTTPGWQLKTPLVYRIPGGRLATPQFGGCLIRQGDEEFYSRAKIWGVTRPRPETPTVS